MRGNILKRAAATLTVMLATGGVHAQDAPGRPLSAIDWLSDSVAPADDPTAAPPPLSAAPRQIDVTALDAPQSGATGLLPPAVTGLPLDLWGRATDQDAVARISATPRDLSPALANLLRTLLLAEAEPVRAVGDPDALLLARVDRLLEMGALDEASGLLEAAGVVTPDRFRRYFDASLLQGRERSACALMRVRPDISPTYPARIFCLARSGDWAAAALTLETAASLDILSPEQDTLLARFLDPDIVGSSEIGFPQVTPLTFRLAEAVGDPLPTRALPLAFAWSDLRPIRGWKPQLEAAERLARAGAIPPSVLIGLYREQTPSASGGVWDRVAAIQSLDLSLHSGGAAQIAAALVAAWRVMAEAELHHVLADAYGRQLSVLPLEGQARKIALKLGLLSGDYQRVAMLTTPQNARERFLIALARGLPESAIADDGLALALREGFLVPTISDTVRQLLAEGRSGEIILRAIRQLDDGNHGDLDGIAEAISALRALNRDEDALKASLELLLINEGVEG